MGNVIHFPKTYCDLEARRQRLRTRIPEAMTRWGLTREEAEAMILEIIPRCEPCTCGGEEQS